MIIRALVLVLLVAGCNRDSRDNSWFWDMDPRLAARAEWAYACMLDVTGLAATNTLPVPPVQGVNEPWGRGAFGEFYKSGAKRFVRAQITRPDSHVSQILIHEFGHDADWRLHGKSTGEDYANWVEIQCREKNMPGIYPAPRIDWDAG